MKIIFKLHSNSYLPACLLICLCQVSGLTEFTNQNLQAEELKPPRIVITPNKTERKQDKSAASITVITEADIKRSQKTQVIDILRTVPGVDVVRSGGPGGNSAVFIRGANSEHTLILLDGVELNNPITTSRSFNMTNLSLANIERIEILRGAQSIYGSDAMGGVIALYSKKGTELSDTRISLEGGAYQTFTQKVATSGKSNNLAYSASVDHQSADSFSAAKDSLTQNEEDDNYENTSFSSNLNYDLNSNLSLGAVFRYQNSNSDIDNSGGSGADDPNRKLNDQTNLVKLNANYLHSNIGLKHNFFYSHTDHQLIDNNDPDNYNAFDFLRSSFNGQQDKFSWQSNYQIIEELTVIFGTETEQEQANSKYKSDGLFGPYEDNLSGKSNRINGYYLELLADPYDNFSIASGVRLDDHSVFGSQPTAHIAPVLNIPTISTKLKSSYATGFKAPSLYQLYSSFGNQMLDPETSQSWEVGFENTSIKNTNFGANYFYQNINNLIDFDPQTFIFANTKSANFQGFEVFSLLNLSKYTQLNLEYTYTAAIDESTNAMLLRRARNKGLIELLVNSADNKWTTSLELAIKGKRFDNDFSSFPAQKVTLSSYALWNAKLNYRFNEALSIFGRIDNILDKEYVEVLGYNTPGMAAFAGVEYKL